MPLPRIVIAKLLVDHTVHVEKQLDELPIGIAMVNRDILPRAVTHWPPPTTPVRAAGWLFIGGTIVFSGSLYLLALTGARWWGAVTPIGGVLFLAGWLSLAIGIWRR